MRLLNVLFIAFFTLALGGTASAQDTDSHVKIRLLPERGIIKAGEELWLGIEQSIDPEWHTYWKNPGDSGSEPRAKWNLPEGFEIGDIQWPTPEKIPYGPLLNYGYADNVILLQKLTAPITLPTGPITLTADIEVLVCKEECIPEFGTYEITLNGPDGTAEDNTAYIEAALTKLPTKTNWLVSYAEQNNEFILSFKDLSGLELEGIELDSVQFFPTQWGVINNVAPPEARLENGMLVLRQARGDRPLNALDKIDGVLSFAVPNGPHQAASFTATPAGLSAALSGAPSLNSQQQATQNTGFLKAALLALLGGLVLNLMPCVFPVLSIKALSLVKTAEKHPEQARIHGLSYTAGVMLSFLAIAGLLIALKLGGAQIGWGFQLQNPIVVTLLAYLLFIIGLNLSGVFEFGAGLTNIGGKLTQNKSSGHGYGNSFFTGVLATLVATPCTAPLMGVAIGYALLQPAFVSLSIFAALGFGLALPYLLLSFLPSLQHILPKPGAWMDVFKQLLAFPMYASAAWLIWVLSQQAGTMGLLGALFGMVAIAFGLWLLSHKPKGKKLRLLVNILIALSFLAAIGFLPAGDTQPPAMKSDSAGFGEAYTPPALEEALSSNDPVFVEMTAAWCITCKVNHATSLNIPETQSLFNVRAVRYLIGDWTNQDPDITKYLDSFGRNGVPLYVYYGTPDENGIRPEPKLLPQILTPAIVANFVNEKAS